MISAILIIVNLVAVTSTVLTTLFAIAEPSPTSILISGAAGLVMITTLITTKWVRKQQDARRRRIAGLLEE